MYMVSRIDIDLIVILKNHQREHRVKHGEKLDEK